MVTRTLITASCLALVAAVGCGGRVSGPTGPSGSTGATGATGATITGTVNGGNMALSTASVVSAGLKAAAAPSGMTVTVVGTNLTASVDVLGQFELAGVPSGNVQLEFKHGSVSATIQLSNVGEQELVQIQVTVSGTTATVVNDVRSTGKVSLCHSTGTGSYQIIEVSVSAEPAHRAHGDGVVGDPVPADPTKIFDADCRAVAVPVAVTASVKIKKSTNGQDADEAPGSNIAVGSPVAWQYVVTNTGQVALTTVVVADDRGVAVSCPGTTLAIGQSMTCTGSGVATAGQYKNVGTVTASSTAGAVTSSDASHYFGLVPSEEVGPKVQICHRTGNGQYHLLEVSVSAEPAHRAHGDAKIGEPVPGSPGKVFTPSCGVS
jgi:hypothetical protein